MNSSPSSSDPLPRLGRYQVIHKLAQGGMAEIFLAKAVGVMGFERLVAIKLIHSHLTRDSDFVKMFIDEARIAMHLSHRNIVQVLDLDKTGDTYFIAMEFIHGVNLYDVYERIAARGRWIDLPIALYIIAEVCKGLHFAHTRHGPTGKPMGIVHRDISPQNVLLSFEGEVKITDFGIARAAERLHETTPGIVKGKYAYMAPEILKEKTPDARVDVFAAGVVLYELLVGENPYAGASAVETIENVLNHEVPAPSKRGAPVAGELDRIVLRALAKDPDERYQTAQEFAEALTEYGLNLTQTRRDIAAGDATIATLLAELFADRLRATPGAIASARTSQEPRGETLPNASKPASKPPAQNAPAKGANPSRGTKPHDDLFDDPAEPATMRQTDSSAVLRPPDDDRTIENLRPISASARDLSAPIPPFRSESTEPDDLRTDSDLRAQDSVPPPPAEEEDEDDRTLLNANGRASLAPPKLVVPAVMPANDPSELPTGRPPVVPSNGTDLHTRDIPALRRGGWSPRLTGAILVVLAAVIVGGAMAVHMFASPKNVELSINTIPQGAHVTIDDVEQPGITPFTTPLTIGPPHIIVMWSTGFQPITRIFQAPAGTKTAHIDISLAPVLGSLVVRPREAGARVLVDGVEAGHGDTTVNKLPLNKPLRLRVELPGYKPYESTITLTADAPVSSQEPKLERE